MKRAEFFFLEIIRKFSQICANAGTSNGSSTVVTLAEEDPEPDIIIADEPDIVIADDEDEQPVVVQQR
jgi:hypothetical protein